MFNIIKEKKVILIEYLEYDVIKNYKSDSLRIGNL